MAFHLTTDTLLGEVDYGKYDLDGLVWFLTQSVYSISMTEQDIRDSLEGMAPGSVWAIGPHVIVRLGN